MAASVYLSTPLLVILAYAAILASAAAFLARTPRKGRPGTALAMATAYAASFLLALYQSYIGTGAAAYAMFPPILSVIFVMSAVGYFGKRAVFYYSMGLAVSLILFSTALGAPITMLMQAFSVGTLAGISISLRGNRSAAHNSRAKDRGVEIKRDLFQICSGIVLLLVLLALPGAGKYIVYAIVLSGYAAVSYIPKKGRRRGVLSSVLLSLERPATRFGFGALYLAAGAMMVMSLIPNFRLMVFGLIALFVADSLATIFGLRIKSPRLPYNKGKSIAGSLVYFAALAAFGMLFVGYYSVAIAAVLALVEGLGWRIDDNISVASVLVLISAALTL